MDKNSKLILLIEDEPVIANIWKERIEEEGYLVAVTNNPETAINYINDGLNYRLLICDRSLVHRSLDGNDVRRASKEKNPNVPVIDVSGYSDLPQYADDHIVKGGISSRLLIEIIKKYLEKDK